MHGLPVLTNALAAAIAAGGASAPPPMFHAVAFVNDPLSHGVLGDGLLSLNEAILLHNGQLAYSQLSLAERAQLSLIPGTGATTDVTWIDIDGTNTPVITIEQDLAPVLDTTFGLLIKGFGDTPVLDFSAPGLTRGLHVPANSMSLQDLIFAGGPYGVDVVQTDVSGQAGLTLQNVRFENPAQFGVRVTATTANGVGRVILEQCQFVNCPTALIHDESGPGRTTIFEAHEVDVVGGNDGWVVTLGAGGSTRYTFDRVTIDTAAHGLQLLRAPTADRSAYLEGQFVRVRAAECVSFACNPTALTWALLHLWDLRAPTGGLALHFGNAGDALFGELTEMTLDGDTSIGTGAAPSPLTLHNLRCRNGAVSLATTAAQSLQIELSRFDACVVTTAGSGPIVASQCCFVGGGVSATVAAPMLVSDSYVESGGANVQQTQGLLAAQLASSHLVPENVLVGGSVQFVADVPPGLVGVFVLGATNSAPVLLPPPFHLYFDAVSYVLLPGIYQAQQSYTWQLPSSPLYVGFDFVVQLAVLPLSVPAPWLQLPPGQRFVLH